ncbi:MAG: hypothetical protein OXU45_03885, partial [Candidatus Melainabacteria bacterium]|nr:hypothetical protein [Candidatus Melainabacteria bacterium]
GYYPVVDFGSTNKDGSVNLFLPIETRTLSTKSQEVLHKVFGEFFDDVRISNGDFVYGLIEDDANHNFGFYNHYPCVNLAALRKQALESDENHLEAVAIHEVAHKILYSKFDPSQLRSEKDPELGKWLMSLSEIISFAVGLELDFKHIRSLISAADQPEHYYSIAVNVLKSAIKQADPDYFGKRRAFCSFHLGLFLDELKKIFQAQDFIRNYFMATAKSVLKSLVPSSLS